MSGLRGARWTWLGFEGWVAIGRSRAMLLRIAFALVGITVVWLLRFSGWIWLACGALLLVDYLAACFKASRLPAPPGSAKAS